MSKDHWLKLTLTNVHLEEDILSAWLNLYEVDSIQFLEDHIDIYINEDQELDIKKLLTEQLGFNAADISTKPFHNQNWNAVWESNFEPVIIDSLYLRAEFHETNNEGLEEIIILPKMAFGTGHHDTTYLMMSEINKMDWTNKVVLDYGCGTGILSILPLKRGCKSLVAIDIQSEAIENTLEHFEANKCPKENYSVTQGDLDSISDRKYDFILANINRHVLIAKAPKLLELITNDGRILCSGILREDQDIMTQTFEEAGFKIKEVQSRGEWLLMIIQKR